MTEDTKIKLAWCGFAAIPILIGLWWWLAPQEISK